MLLQMTLKKGFKKGATMNDDDILSGNWKPVPEKESWKYIADIEVKFSGLSLKDELSDLKKRNPDNLSLIIAINQRIKEVQAKKEQLSEYDADQRIRFFYYALEEAEAKLEKETARYQPPTPLTLLEEILKKRPDFFSGKETLSGLIAVIRDSPSFPKEWTAYNAYGATRKNARSFKRNAPQKPTKSFREIFAALGMEEELTSIYQCLHSKQ